MKNFIPTVVMMVVWCTLMISGYLVGQQVLPSESWAYRFVYERGPVQWVILGVAVWSTLMLYGRWRRYCRQAAQFRSFLQQQSPPPGALGEVLRRASRFWQEAGAKAVRTYLDQLRTEQHEALDKYYDLLRYLIGALPFLGLFGTVVGLSMALEQAFSQGMGNGAVEKFVAGLAVALDTTILGMACAAPLFTCLQWLLARHHGLVDQIIGYLRKQFRLDELPPDQDELAAVLQEELGRITNHIANEAKTFYAELSRQTKSTFTELAAESLQTLQALFQQGVRQHLSEYQQAQQAAWQSFTTQTRQLFHEGFQQVSQTVADHFQQMLHEHQQMVEQHNQFLHAQLQQFHQQQHELFHQQGQMVADRLDGAVAQMADSVANCFQPTINSLGESVRHVHEAIQHLEEAMRQSQQDWPGRVKEALQALPGALQPILADLVHQTAQQAQQFHSSLTNRLTEQMSRLERAIHNRTPEEIVIRYRDGQYVSKESDQCPEPILV